MRVRNSYIGSMQYVKPETKKERASPSLYYTFYIRKSGRQILRILKVFTTEKEKDI